MQIKSEWRRRDGGDPACLSGIDVSLDVFFREEPVRRDVGGGYHTTREEEAPCSSPTRVVSPQHNDGFSQAITRTAVMCIAYTPTRAHRNNNNTTVFRLSVERERKRELKRERETEGKSLLKRFCANRVQSCREVCGGLQESLGEIDKGLRRFSREIARFSK